LKLAIHYSNFIWPGNPAPMAQILADIARGRDALTRRRSTPGTTHPAFAAEAAEQLRGLLHRSPRDAGHATSCWTLPLLAEVSFAEGLTATQVSGETVRATLVRLGVRWPRAKRWIHSPDPDYARKKANATG